MSVLEELEKPLHRGHRRVRRAPQSHDLPHEDAERPAGEGGKDLDEIHKITNSLENRPKKTDHSRIQEFVQRNSNNVHSHVRLRGVEPVEEGFGRHPLDGEPPLARLPVVVHTLDVPGEPEVADLHDALLAHQHVPRGEVAVHALVRLEGVKGGH